MQGLPVCPVCHFDTEGRQGIRIVRLFREKAESLGRVYVSKVGMKLSFNAPNGDDKEKAAELKKLCKADPQLNTVYFQCTTA